MHFQTRSKKGLWPQIEATFKQMDVAATEFECFQALKKQEQLAASHRINNLWSEVQKQKELERTLQKRYGDLMADLERTQNVIEQFRVQAQLQEEIEAKSCALEGNEVKADEINVHGVEDVQTQQEKAEAKNQVLESTEATADEINVQGTENCEAAPLSADQQIVAVHDQDTSSSKNDMDVELPDAPAAEDESAKIEEACIENKETTLDMSAAVEIKSNEGNEEGQDVQIPDEVMESANQPDNSTRESTLDDMQVSEGKNDEAN